MTSVKDEAPEGGNPPGASLAACPATTQYKQGPQSNSITRKRNEESPARVVTGLPRSKRTLWLGHRGAESCLGLGTRRKKHTSPEGRVKSLRIWLWDRCGSFLPINRYFFSFFAASADAVGLLN